MSVKGESSRNRRIRREKGGFGLREGEREGRTSNSLESVAHVLSHLEGYFLGMFGRV
jgi:hypothetical protein